MRAIQQLEFGPPDRLRHTQLPDPVPAPGQVRIAVEAAGVHVIDTVIRAGVEGGPFPLPTLPMVPGREVAGVVDAAGSAAEAGWVGRRAVAHLGQASGGYAELAVAPVAALHEMPAHVGAAEAVAMIGTGRTAMAVVDAARLAAGDVVLVTGAAGGLGNLLVQAVRHLGGVAVGLAGGPEKVARVRDVGADVAVDYLVDGWPDRVRQALAGREASAVLDGVGGAAGRAALELLGPGGRLVLIGWSAGEPTPFTPWDVVGRSLTVTAAIGPALARRPGGLRDLETRALAAVANQVLTPLVTRFPLEGAAAAHAAVEGRVTIGKTVLVPARRDRSLLGGADPPGGPR